MKYLITYLLPTPTTHYYIYELSIGKEVLNIIILITQSSFINKAAYQTIYLKPINVLVHTGLKLQFAFYLFLKTVILSIMLWMLVIQHYTELYKYIQYTSKKY